MTRVEAFWKGEQISIRKASKKSTPFLCLALNDIRTRANNKRRMIKIRRLYLRKRKKPRILINLNIGP
jgi:hypothetical protein